MNEDGRSRSRLPEDPAYWRALADRSVQAAFEADRPVTAARGRRFPAPDLWWGWFADAAPGLAAAALLAVVGGYLLIGERGPSGPAAPPGAIAAGLAPDEPMLRSLLASAAEPPPPAAMLGLVRLRGGER